MNERKCPACGELLQGTEEKCPACGLAGVNRRFLSRAGYEKWVQEVLEPHKAAMTLRVIAGPQHRLILTGWGGLYGIGNDYSGQIEENSIGCVCTGPQLMAKDVISAAAGSHYTIFVTRDGEVHLRGRGEIAERFSGFSGAKEVHAADDSDCFWIVDETDRVWCFGENEREQLEPRKRTACYDFPGERYRWVVSGYESYACWERGGRIFPSDSMTDDLYRKYGHGESGSVRLKYWTSPEYRKYHAEYGSNLDLVLHTECLNDSNNDAYGWRGYRSGEMYFCKALLCITNDFIYKPVPCPAVPEKKPEPRPDHREELPKELEGRPVVKTLSCWICDRDTFAYGSSRGVDITLWLLEDGSVMLKDEKECKPLHWLQHPVIDIMEYANYVVLICKDGIAMTCCDLLNMKNGTVKVWHLREDA